MNGNVSCTARCTLARAALSTPAGTRTTPSAPAPSAFVVESPTVLPLKLAAAGAAAARASASAGGGGTTAAAAAAVSIVQGPLAAASSLASRANSDSEPPRNFRSCSSRPALDSSSSSPSPCPAAAAAATAPPDVNLVGAAGGVDLVPACCNGVAEGSGGGGTGGGGRSKLDASTSRPDKSISFTCPAWKRTARRSVVYCTVNAT